MDSFFFLLKNCFSHVKLAFSEEVAFIQRNAACIITFLFRFSQRVQPIDCYSLNNTDLFWQTVLLGISFNIEAFLIDSEEFVFEQCVRLFRSILQCLQADKLRATKFSR